MMDERKVGFIENTRERQRKTKNERKEGGDERKEGGDDV